MANWALIGGSGYVSPKHYRAVKETGNNLVAVLDPNDSIGILDSYFPHAKFFTSFERFDRYLDKLRREGNAVEYISICSPNHLHDTHIRYALRNGAHAICEKPLTLTTKNVDGLNEFKNFYTKQVNVILQLRLHQEIIKLKERVDKTDGYYKVDLRYITARGAWYFSSWKGDEAKSGGLATNIGIHLFDMLLWVFGEIVTINLTEKNEYTVEGNMRLKKADVSFLLSVDENMLPVPPEAGGHRAVRTMTVDNEPIDFTLGFEDLHTLSYKKILAGEGFTVNDARQGIMITQSIREM